MSEHPSSLAALLFEPSEDGTKAPFASQSDLARVISNLPNSSYQRRLASVRALVQQVLAGNRKFPDALAEDLVRAAQQQGVTPAFLRTLRAEIEQHNELTVPAARKTVAQRDHPLDAIASRQAIASQVIIFTPLPLELQTDLSPQAAALCEEAVQAFLNKDPETEYTFCVPKDEIAFDLWKYWLKRLARDGTAEQAMATLDEREQNPSGPEVTVYVIPPPYCLHPLVVLNMKEKDRGRHAAFIWYTKYDEHAILQLPDLFLDTEWKDSVYTPLCREDLPGQRRIKWAAVREKLKESDGI